MSPRMKWCGCFMKQPVSNLKWGHFMICPPEIDGLTIYILFSGISFLLLYWHSLWYLKLFSNMAYFDVRNYTAYVFHVVNMYTWVFSYLHHKKWDICILTYCGAHLLNWKWLLEMEYFSQSLKLAILHFLLESKMLFFCWSIVWICHDS